QTFSYYDSAMGVWHYNDVISAVQAFDGRGNLVETVSYGYDMVWVGYFFPRQCYYLTHVYYDDGTQAAYTYERTNIYNSPDTWAKNTAGVVHSCDDVRYAGPMKQIEYEYMQWGDPTDIPIAWGQIKSENNFNTHQVVSRVTYPTSSYDAAMFQRIETRGDGHT